MIRERPNLKNTCVYTVGYKQSKMSNIYYYNAHYITMRDRLLLETVNAMIPLFNLLPENEKFSAVMQNKTPKVMKVVSSSCL